MILYQSKWPLYPNGHYIRMATISVATISEVYCIMLLVFHLIMSSYNIFLIEYPMPEYNFCKRFQVYIEYFTALRMRGYL